MKKLLCFLMILAVPTWVFAVDAIYLKTGKILKGKITEESGDTITLEGEDAWHEVKRADIKKIERGVAQQQAAPQAYPQQGYPPQQAYVPPPPAVAGSIVGSLRLGYDLPGNLNIISTGDVDEDVESGITLGLDIIKGYRILGWGMGLELLMQRGLKQFPEAKFGFLSIPYTLEFSSYENYRNGLMAPYFRLQGGFSIFLPSDQFLGTADNDVIGSCVGIGFGVRRKQNFIAELRYNLYTASINDDLVSYFYSAPRLSVGYSF